MKRFKKEIAAYIERVGAQKGIDIGIGNILFFKRKLTDIGMKLKEGNISIKSLQIRPNLLTCLYKEKKVAITCKDIVIDCHSFSKEPFQISNISFNIIYDVSNKNIRVDATLYNGVVCHFNTSRQEDGRAFGLKIEDISIDRYKILFNSHISSTFLQSIQSDSILSFTLFFNHSNKVLYPQIQTSFNCHSLKISSTNYTLSKNYLLSQLETRKHLGKYYIRYEHISKQICQMVICTEDPSFHIHKGICPVQMGITLREAINQKKLGRGGSTISMQLIKNALLNSERTINRKLEEAILTLLMENYYHINKNDIIELYLNMIELAPDVYGIEDGARFYFDKPANQLAISEIITLTYIIPRPKHFYEALLLKTEQLQHNLGRHITNYGGIALRKGIISSQEEINNDCIIFSKRFGVLPLIKE